MVILGFLRWGGGRAFNCATDPASIGICTDLHEYVSKNIVDWACVSPSCEDKNVRAEFADGCSSIEFLVERGVDQNHGCIVAWAELARDNSLSLGLLGLEDSQTVVVSDSELIPDPLLAWNVAVVGPGQLQQGQFFELQVFTDHRPASGRIQMLVRFVGNSEAILAERDVNVSAASSSGAWTTTLPGRIAHDRSLVGGPHVIEVALLDAAGKIGAVAQWLVVIVDGFPPTCPDQADCGAQACGREPLCGVPCGACPSGQACSVAGQCELTHPNACPVAAQCGLRVCGADPICGVTCGPGCPSGQTCTADGRCELEAVSTSAGTTTGGGDSGDSATTEGESTDQTGSDETGAHETSSDMGDCGGVQCANGGSCVAGVCVCAGDFDPATQCQTCRFGLVELGGVCVPDRCLANPCHIGGLGHGESCTVIGADEGSYTCTCLGDYTPSSGCLSCPADKIPGSGHACQDPTGSCQGVICGVGASCDATSGVCECNDPGATMAGNGNCLNPCDGDPCHIADGGHGESCTPTGITTYICTCSGGHVPESNCEACPSGQSSNPGGDCEENCPWGETRCGDSCFDLSANDAHCGACNRMCGPSEHCVNGQCRSDCLGGDVFCDGRCVDPKTSTEFCGARGTCNAADVGERCGDEENCVDGACVAEELCPSGAVRVPGGTYNDAFGIGTHIIDDLCMHLTEVSVADYMDCTRADNDPCPRPTTTNNLSCNSRDEESYANHPINCVAREDANLYCAKLGMRLPTEWEWEWAARGRERGWLYPWGDDEVPSCELATLYSCTDDSRTLEVDSFPSGQSRDGIFNLIGNVSEMTSSVDPSDAEQYVLRGGSMRTHAIDASILTRESWPTKGYSFIGFRCVSVR